MESLVSNLDGSQVRLRSGPAGLGRGAKRRRTGTAVRVNEFAGIGHSAEGTPGRVKSLVWIWFFGEGFFLHLMLALLNTADALSA